MKTNVSLFCSGIFSRWKLGLASAAAAVAFLSTASAQTLDSFYASSYSIVDLGVVSGVPGNYGGVVFKAGDPNTLLIGGNANQTGGSIYSIGVVRDPSGHITGFSGTASFYAQSPSIDGGLAYGPDDVLFFTGYPTNTLGQIKPGSTAPDKTVNLSAAGVTASVGSVAFVPPGFPGAGRVKLLSFSAASWFDVQLTADGNGTFDVTSVGPGLGLQPLVSGPEGATFISAGNPQFANASVLVTAYSAGKVVAYEIDANGDPIVATGRPFLGGLTGAEGAVIDPVTGDFLFSTFGGGNHVVAVRGFVAPDTATEVPTLTAPLDGATVGSPIAVQYTLPEAALAGSVQLKFHDASEGVEVEMVLDASGESQGAHLLSIDADDPGGSVGVASVTGGAITDGTYSVIVSYQDALGNDRAFDANLNVEVVTGPHDPTYTSLYSKGGAVPGAGSDSRIGNGALFTTIYVPAVNANGVVAFRAKWKAGKVTKEGIFAGGNLIVSATEEVPGIGGVKFKAFKDPVIDDDGHVAFLATISGSGVTTGSDSVVVSTGRNGSVEVLAREGGSAPDAAGAVFKSFQNVSITGGPEVVATAAKGAVGNGIPLPSSGGCTVFTATLSGSVDKTNDTGAWWLPAGAVSVELMIREGQALPDGLGNVKTFQVLKTVGGSPGQGRGLADGNSALIQAASTTTGTQAQLLALPGSLSVVAATGDVLGGSTLPVAQWSKMSLPSTGGAGQFVSVLGELKKNVGGVTGLYTKGIFASEDSGDTWEPVVRVTDNAPGFDSGAKFTMFKDPVNSSTGAGVAFIATAKGGAVTTASDTGIWWQPEASSLSLVAREGAEPPGAPEGAKWKSFDSVALPGGETGPLFLAKLAVGPGGITTAGDVGLYGVDSAGAVRALLREGTPLLGKTVKTFNVLKAVASVNGSSRSFNKSAAVVALVTYTDASVGIVKIDVP